MSVFHANNYEFSYLYMTVVGELVGLWTGVLIWTRVVFLILNDNSDLQPFDEVWSCRGQYIPQAIGIDKAINSPWTDLNSRRKTFCFRKLFRAPVNWLISRSKDFRLPSHLYQPFNESSYTKNLLEIYVQNISRYILSHFSNFLHVLLIWTTVPSSAIWRKAVHIDTIRQNL